MKRPNPQKLVDDFNARVSVGDQVAFSEVIGLGDAHLFNTASPAEVLSGHSAVVWLEGKCGCVLVSHCQPVIAP